MEQFLLGLLVGIAIGMWGAILLYRVMGKQQPGWPMRRKKGDGKTKSTGAYGVAPDLDAPDDDFDEAYYAEHYSEMMAGVQSAPAQTAPATEPAPDARSTVVYTGPRDSAVAAGQSEEVEDKEWAAGWDDESPGTDRPAGAAEPLAGETSVGDAYRRLLELTEGDVQAAEELIEAEYARTPAVPRARLIENAIDRLEYGEG